MNLVELSAKNFCCFSDFVLPLSEQGLVLISAKNNDTAAAENNGAGKTTLFKALTWCLYGESIDGERGDKVIMDGARQTVVEASLEDESGKWKIIRERKKGAPKVSLIQPNGKHFKASKMDVQTKVNEMIGLDFHAFKNTVLFGQNDSSRFANPRTKDSDRKKMLHKILRTDVFERCHKVALEQRKTFRDKISNNEKELISPVAKLEEIDFDKLTRRSEAFEDSRAKQVEDYMEEAESYKQKARDELEESNRKDESKEIDTDKIDRKINRLRTLLKKMEGTEDKIEVVEERIEAEKAKRSNFESQLSAGKAMLREYKEQLSELGGKSCPVCTSDLKGGNAAAYISGIKDKEFKVREKIYVVKEEIEEIDYDIKGLVAKKRKIQAAILKIRESREQLEALEDERDDELRRKINEDERRREAKKRAKVFVDSARNCLRTAREAQDSENIYEKQIEDLKKKEERYEKQIKTIKETIEDTKEKLSYVEFWERGFSNQGLPSYILDSVMPFLSERANLYLRALSDGDIKMEFSTQREMKSRDEKKDEIEITWEIEGRKNYPPSGGQQKKMEIATDFALMDLVATKEGGYVNLLALDEILDGLDAEGTRRVIMLLKKLREHRGSIFVISHSPEISESFEKSILVTKKSGVSTLRHVA